MRAVFFAVSSLDRNINLTICIILLSILLGIHGLVSPLKCKAQNVQEFLWLINLQGLYVFSLYGQGATNIIFVNILVVIAMVQFSIIVVYHIITYTWIGHQIVSVCTSRCVAVTDVIRSRVTFSTNQMVPNNIELNAIPDVIYNYREYREPLVGL